MLFIFLIGKVGENMNGRMKVFVAMAVVVLLSGFTQAKVLYHIASFNNNGSTADNNGGNWKTGITTIIRASGITGTDDAGLLSLQTIAPNADTVAGGVRFRNVGDVNSLTASHGTVIADTTGYFQFGIAGNDIDLTNLTFKAVQATTSAATRGYKINVSINGAAYVDLAASNVANNRNNGLQQFNIDMTGLARGLSSVDFRVYTTGGGVEYTDFQVIGAAGTIGHPPAFTNDLVIKQDGAFREEYGLLAQTLAGSATDPDAGATLSYSVLTGPDWLIVAENGALSGVAESHGSNEWTIAVNDEHANFDTATLRIYLPVPSLTTFLGGNMRDGANWNYGLPDAQVPGLMPVSGSASGFEHYTGWLGAGALVTVNNGATLNVTNDFATSAANWIITNATVNCYDDFFVQKATVTLNADSVTTAIDDWEAQEYAGRIIVNGGTHASGTGTDNNVGAQGDSGRIGCGIDFRGGTVTAGNFRFQTNSVSSVSGSAILASHGATTTFSDARGTINFVKGWTGSWTVGSFSGDDWANIVTASGNGFRLEGAVINAAVFSARFIVAESGTKLMLKPNGTVIMLR